MHEHIRLYSHAHDDVISFDWKDKSKCWFKSITHGPDKNVPLSGAHLTCGPPVALNASWPGNQPSVFATAPSILRTKPLEYFTIYVLINRTVLKGEKNSYFGSCPSRCHSLFASKTPEPHRVSSHSFIQKTGPASTPERCPGAHTSSLPEDFA